MLSPREKKLLTAYVDGECSPREAEQVLLLLRRSEDARTLLAGLEEDSQTLRSMASLTIPLDLTAPVVDQARTAPPRLPIPRQAPVARESFPVWRGVAAAAAVLFLVGLASFFLNTGDAPAPKTAKRLSGPNRSESPPAGDGAVARRTGAAPATPIRHEQPPQAPPTLPEWPSAQGPELVNPEDDDPPARPNPTVITSMFDEPLKSLERVTLSLPVIHKAHQLDQAEVANAFLAQLGSGRGFRLELLCRDGTRGLERFRTAMSVRKVVQHLDPVAQARLKKPLIRSHYAVFLENVTPQELLELFRTAAVADRQAAAKKPAEQRFDGAVVVKSLGNLDRKELVELLGIDPVRKRPEPARRPDKVDISKPLTEQTDRQVGEAVRGRAPRPGGDRPALSAMIVPLGGPRVRSADLKRFLNTRTPAQPGTIQALIVLRHI